MILNDEFVIKIVNTPNNERKFNIFDCKFDKVYTDPTLAFFSLSNC